mgnify:CR=1 FL=1
MFKYYTLEQCEKIFNAVKNSKWRIWKIIDCDDKIIQSKFPIASPNDLLKFIRISKNPKALYYSVSCFLNAENNHGAFYKQHIRIPGTTINLFPREGYISADTLLLNTFFFIDIDHETDLSIVQEDGRTIIKELGYPEFLRYSGTKGIHLGYPQQVPEIKDPIKRIEQCKKDKIEITKRLMKLDLKTLDKNHENVMTNLFCEIAAPYSLKSNGNIVRPIDISDFMNHDIHSILSLKPTRARRRNLVSDGLNSPNDENVAIQGRNVLQHSNIWGRGRFSDLSTYPHYFGVVANFVPGLRNNYVPFIKMHKSRKVDLQDIKEDLGDLLIFGEKNHYWLIGYKLFQKEKLLKVMRKLKASNIVEFERRYAKFRFTNVLDKDRKEIMPPPKLIYRLKSKKSYTYSLAHKNFFKEFDEQDKMYGNPILKTYEAISRP